MPEDRIYIPFPFRTPRMDTSVPPNQVKPGSFGRLSGVDGRFYINGLYDKTIDATSWIPHKFTYFQCKAVRGLSPSNLESEVLTNTGQIKPRIIEILQNKGAYIVVVTKDWNYDQVTNAIGYIKNGLRRGIDVSDKTLLGSIDDIIIKIYTAQNLRNWINEYLGISLEVIGLTTGYTPFVAETWNEWSNNDSMTIPMMYVPDDIRTEIIYKIKCTLFENSTKSNIFRIEGLSGYGKTRLVLEIFRSNGPEDIIHTLQKKVVYFDQPNQVTGHIFNWRRTNTQAILII
ncbi:hypothetical protein LCGC14_2688260, partial [marine sediment metagenome]